MMICLTTLIQQSWSARPSKYINKWYQSKEMLGISEHKVTGCITTKLFLFRLVRRDTVLGTGMKRLWHKQRMVLREIRCHSSVFIKLWIYLLLYIWKSFVVRGVVYMGCRGKTNFRGEEAGGGSPWQRIYPLQSRESPHLYKFFLTRAEILAKNQEGIDFFFFFFSWGTTA